MKEECATANYKEFDWISEEDDKRYIQNTYKNIGIKEGREEGLKQGREETIQGIVKNLNNLGYSLEDIKTITNLSDNEIKTILDK